MQPVWLCVFSGRQFEEAFAKTHYWRNVKQLKQFDTDTVSELRAIHKEMRQHCNCVGLSVIWLLTKISFLLLKITLHSEMQSSEEFFQSRFPILTSSSFHFKKFISGVIEFTFSTVQTNQFFCLHIITLLLRLRFLFPKIVKSLLSQ